MTKKSLAELNDAFRKGDPNIPGKITMTNGIARFSNVELLEIVKLIRSFDDFSEENDLYGEHDFGSIVYKKDKIYWKIDYYDPSLTKGSEDPTDLSKTVRILTIMLAAEY